MLDLLRQMRQTVSNKEWFSYTYLVLDKRDVAYLHHIMSMACLLNSNDFDTIKQVFKRLYETEAAHRDKLDEFEDPQSLVIGLIDLALAKVTN